MSCSVASPEYLNELLSDKTTVSKMPKIFLHAERLLDQEISRVRNELFHGVIKNEADGVFGELQLPASSGPRVKLSEKVYAPVKEYPKFNFVGRVIGPRGMTLREVESSTGCKLLVRGKGSMKDKKLEEEKRGQPNYEHLEEDLHVLISVEDTEERAKLRLAKAVERAKDLLQPVDEGEDELKKKQLKDLALMNGTLREQAGCFFSPEDTICVGNTPVIHNGLLGMPLPPALAGYGFARPPVPSAYPASLSGLELASYTTRPGTIFDYGLETSILGAVKPRRPIREHPYQR
ncbi:protein quaking-like isoform X1 [Stylophora pistillata]|uniref:protein quaking-like isoform X1 n=1 Tax=Stylophora pistillata TaxID=50429 RepID=UPI000C04E5BA|nr:protein quaking-like isoform X1 [Stylophora pistillata]XP_022781975.1 protein quaking-like isoform X1 [Stylophora pistillata]